MEKKPVFNKQPIHRMKEIGRPAVILTKSEVAQYFSGDSENVADARLVKKVHDAIEILKEHSKQDETKKTNTAEKTNIEIPKNEIEEVLTLDFTGIISDTMLKE